MAKLWQVFGMVLALSTMSRAEGATPTDAYQAPVLVTHEMQLIKAATHLVVPQPIAAPDSSKLKVVVAELAVALRTGRIVEIKLLEAPAGKYADTVESALRKWRFLPGTQDGTLVGRVTFYYMPNGEVVMPALRKNG